MITPLLWFGGLLEIRKFSPAGARFDPTGEGRVIMLFFR